MTMTWQSISCRIYSSNGAINDKLYLILKKTRLAYSLNLGDWQFLAVSMPHFNRVYIIKCSHMMRPSRGLIILSRRDKLCPPVNLRAPANRYYIYFEERAQYRSLYVVVTALAFICATRHTAKSMSRVFTWTHECAPLVMMRAMSTTPRAPRLTFTKFPTTTTIGAAHHTITK